MPRRSPARWLAPIALLACAVAVYAVVSSGLRSEERDRRSADSRSTTARGSDGAATTKRAGRRARKRRRSYTVKAGDTLSAISLKTGVPLTRIKQLNPTVDEQSLQSGQRIRLAP